MTAKIVQFNSKVKSPSVKKKQVTSATGEELVPPSNEDLVGFLNTLNYLALQSATYTVEISTLVDELNISIKHHDNLYEGNDVSAATSFETLANCPYDALSTDKEKAIANLRIMFDRLDIEQDETN